MPTEQEQVTDSRICAAIELQFLTQRGVLDRLIDVETHEGIVELTGLTDSLLSRRRAEEIALAVRGVRGVINEIGILASKMTDQELRRDAERALDQDPNDFNVRCYVHEGALNLSGVVQSWAEKQLVLLLVEGVHGLRRVNADQLGIRGGENVNSDEDITAQIQKLLEWDIRVNARLVQVRTHERVVHLAGTVGTATEREHAVAIAYQAGAERVDARDLLVAYWALDRELRREKFAARSDQDVAQAIRDTFRYDPRVLSTEPGVEVHNGIVTLRGAVSSLLARQAAEQDARNVVGVWDVHNLLKVRLLLTPTDDDLREMVQQALARDPYVGSLAFIVHVRHGRVSLFGRVDNYFEQEQAGRAASGVSGVMELDNRLKVAGPPTWQQAQQWLGQSNSTAPAAAAGLHSDHALAERIRQRYFWSATLHDEDVEVRVDNGRATLNGTVDTWFDRKQAAMLAFEVGARDVNNHLRATMTELPDEY